MKNETYKIKGMDCASCAITIEKTFSKTEGVHSASVNYGNESAKISFDESKVSIEDLSKKIKPLGYSFVMPTSESMNMSQDEHMEHLGINQTKNEKLIELKKIRNKLLYLMPMVFISIFIMSYDIFAQLGLISKMPIILDGFFHHLLPILAVCTIFLAGKPYLLGLYRFFRYGKANMDTLIGLGTSIAIIYSFIISAFEESLKFFINVNQSYYDVAIVVIAFITLGKYLEMRSKLRTGDAIEKLLNLQTKTALVVRDEKEIEISINEVTHGED